MPTPPPPCWHCQRPADQFVQAASHCPGCGATNPYGPQGEKVVPPGCQHCNGGVGEDPHAEGCNEMPLVNLLEAIQEELECRTPYQGESKVRRIRTFREAQYLTRDEGLVVEFESDEVYDVTIQRRS